MDAGSLFVYPTPFRPIPVYGQASAFDLHRLASHCASLNGCIRPSPLKLCDNAPRDSTFQSPIHMSPYSLAVSEHIKRLRQENSAKILDQQAHTLTQSPQLSSGHFPISRPSMSINSTPLNLSVQSFTPKFNAGEINTQIPGNSGSYGEHISQQISLGRKLFPCPQCRYTTDRRNNLKRHMLTMHQTCSKLLECCGILFNTKASLREHAMIFHYHGYTCFYCGRRFCRKALLKRHLSVHNGQKDFVCTICDYATSHKSNLERHRRVHARHDDGRSDVSCDPDQKPNFDDCESKNAGDKESDPDSNEELSVCSDSDEEINVHTD
ncbi:Hypothetical predicted protein [Mytilus galloprovincialis]|uniref:C2H2-type domain-containing protein n=1 Tax=Mytilus galloprovincialis TaxID=29158 RepID=A0A8B6BPG5_MYTGA|nr:Hypothetical predicted protein [Mytilus galloprovincialis]